ncbi:MAG: adenylosuccinate synthase [Ardenticatenaceae bacterium]|nr:adenylosuccinate synthase [Ardenticatenaceae bacterium]
MPLDIVIGAQWGDEGKGRVTDLLAREAALVARFSGGDNAGHTVAVDGETFKLHLIPSGIIHAGVTCLVGNGAVLNPAVFIREIEGLAKRGIDVSPHRLKIDRRTHLITPVHKALDQARESQRGDKAIGTTLRGIGPAYAEKIGRSGLRAGLLDKPEELAEAVHDHVSTHNEILTRVYGAEPIDAEKIAAEFAHFGQRLAPHLADGSVLIDEFLKEGRPVLAEGAQGTMLDIDHGTYPFVTSSSPTIGGVLTGLGVGAIQVDKVWGVAKAFSSRVGGGPFTTELDGEDALRLRGTGKNPWDEYGTTTGRPRRVGWLDLVILSHAVRINGFTELCVTKLDILSGIPEIPVCIAYDTDGQRLNYPPADLSTLANCQPIYKALPGWEEDIRECRTIDELPENAQAYIAFIESFLNVPIRLVSVGPERDQVVTV